MGQKAVTQRRPFPGRQAPVWPGNTWSSKASRESRIRGSGLPAQAASGQEITDPAVRTWKHRGDKRKPRQAAPPGGLAWASSRRCPVPQSPCPMQASSLQSWNAPQTRGWSKAPLNPGGDPRACVIKKIPNIFNYLEGSSNCSPNRGSFKCVHSLCEIMAFCPTSVTLYFSTLCFKS